MGLLLLKSGRVLLQGCCSDHSLPCSLHYWTNCPQTLCWWLADTLFRSSTLLQGGHPYRAPHRAQLELTLMPAI